MHLKSRDFSLIWALLHDFPPFCLQICSFIREKSCNPINFSRFARLQPQKVVISSSFWHAITTLRPCLHYLTIGMKKGKNVSTFFPFFSVYFRARGGVWHASGGGCARGTRAAELRGGLLHWCVAVAECSRRSAVRTADQGELRSSPHAAQSPKTACGGRGLQAARVTCQRGGAAGVGVERQ